MKIKLKKFDSSLSGGRSSQPIVSLNKAGSININKHAAELMKLKAKDKVALFQDEEEPADWYIGIDKENGFPLRAAKNDAGFTFNCSAIVAALNESLERENRSCAFPVSTDAISVPGGGGNVYPILTRLEKSRKSSKTE